MPLPNLGTLPPDLQRALDAANDCVGAVSGILTEIRQVGRCVPGRTPPQGGRVERIVGELRGRWGDHVTAVSAVENELIACNDATLHYGPLKTPCAHRAALELALVVLSNLSRASDPAEWHRWQKRHPDAAEWLNPVPTEPRRITENFEAVLCQLPVTGLPDPAAIAADCHREAVQAAARRPADPDGSAGLTGDHLQRIAAAVGDKNGGKILAIAHRNDLTANEKLRLIENIDKRFRGKDSAELATLLGVKAAAVRKTKTWKEWQEKG